MKKNEESSSKDRKTEWFIETLDSNTNEILTRNLRDKNLEPENRNDVMKDNEGHEHSVYQVPDHAFVALFHASTGKFSLKFRVYTRANQHAPIRLWQFEGRKKKKTLKKA